MQPKRSALMASAALTLLAGMGVPVTTVEPIGDRLELRTSTSTVDQQQKSTPAKSVSSATYKAAMLGWRRYSGGRRTFPGYGWSVAHDRRMARKRRNKARAKR